VIRARRQALGRLLVAGGLLLLLAAAAQAANLRMARPAGGPEIPTPTPSATPAPNRTPDPTRTAEPGPTPTATPSEWAFGQVDLANPERLQLAFLLPGATIYTRAFEPQPYELGILAWDGFGPGSGKGIAWADWRARLGLWLHSGPDTTMTDLQAWLEADERAYILWPAEVNASLAAMVGSRAILRQGDRQQWARVAAAVRVKPLDVAETQDHVDDLLEHLGLGEIEPPVLMLYFCGRQLQGERVPPFTPHWQTARFVIVLQPEG